jgi:hypothetical protein
MLMTIIAIMTATMAKSEENKYPMCADKATWFEKNWCETVEFQKDGWEQGKTQLANDKETVTNFVDRIVTYITQK